MGARFFSGRFSGRVLSPLIVTVMMMGVAVSVAPAAESPATALGVYMERLFVRAAEEPPIAIEQRDELPRLVIQSQNHAEAERFREAAETLRPLSTQPGVDAHWQASLQARIAALSQLEREIEPAALRTLFLKTSPHWFNDRLKPIALAWRLRTSDSAAKLQLVADLFEQAQDAQGHRLALLALADLRSISSTHAAEALLAAGNSAHRHHDFAAAIQDWEALVRRYPETPSWFKALYNLGGAKQHARAFHEAIVHFKRLIASNPPDREPGGSIMQNYRNYSHYAALGISDCYEALRDFNQALRWVELAATKYPLQAWCGTCLVGAEDALAQRTERLKTKQAWLK